LNEALGLAVGAGRVGTGKALAERQGPAGRGYDARAIPRAVVAKDAFGHDAPPSEPGGRAAQKARDGDALLVAQHLRVGQARAVIDADMDELPADAAHATAPIAGDAMADPADTAQLFDVDMPQLWVPEILAARFRKFWPVPRIVAQLAR
jgi:hypothetical protein